MALQPYTKEWLEELCKTSYSYAEVIRKAGRKGGGSIQTLKKYIEQYEIDTSHFTGQNWNKGKTKKNDSRLANIAIASEKYQLEDVFKKDSSISQHGLRGYVERHQIVEYKCNICGCDGHWQDGVVIALELHHRDGDNHNNEIDNLIYLCPNCHALTENFKGKNKKDYSTKVVSEEDFVKALQEAPNIRQALLKLGLAARGDNYTRAKNLMRKYNLSKE